MIAGLFLAFGHIFDEVAYGGYHGYRVRYGYRCDG